MPLPERDYYPILTASSIIGCSSDDLIHWAANGKTKLGVIFHMDEFTPERYRWFDEDDKNIKVKEFIGFVYVDQGYFAHLEKSRELAFNSVAMLDGSVVILTPFEFDGVFNMEIRDVEAIYIHRTELLGLISNETFGEEDYAEKPLNKRTENNYLRLILSLANGIEGFNPKKPYEAAQLILDEIDIAISKETLAGYISKAYELESKSRD